MGHKKYKDQKKTYDDRYVVNAGAYKKDSFVALTSQFHDRKNYDSYYESLASDKVKNEFLRVTCFYLYLVKKGDWRVSVKGTKPVIGYLTNSFKLIALFSLIESLSNEKYLDFYQWLLSQENGNIFPVSDKAKLNELYREYKTSFGSIRRCVAFFELLSKERKKELCEAIHQNGKPLSSIKKVAEFLYNLRSKFAHESQLVLSISESTVYSIQKKTRVDLSMAVLLRAFEEGVLTYFKK